MYCMKCGKETEQNHVFCDACLSSMSRRPVKGDVVVQLPVRTPAPARKPAPRKRQRTAEEQMHRLQSAVKWMSLALTCMVLALVLTVSFLVHTASQQHAGQEIGKNYNTVGTVNGSD